MVGYASVPLLFIQDKEFFLLTYVQRVRVCVPEQMAGGGGAIVGQFGGGWQ